MIESDERIIVSSSSSSSDHQEEKDWRMRWSRRRMEQGMRDSDPSRGREEGVHEVSFAIIIMRGIIRILDLDARTNADEEWVEDEEDALEDADLKYWS